MCDPMTAIAVTTTLMGGYQQYQQGKAEEARAKYEARELDNQAIRARNQGTERENDHRSKVAQRIASQRAAQAANGGVVGLGSNLLTQEDTAEVGEIDALRIRQSYDDQVDTLERSAENRRIDGKNAKSAGKFALGASLIGAAGAGFAATDTGKSLSSKWFTGKSAANTGNVVPRDQALIALGA